MHAATGQVNELLLQDGRLYARLSCPAGLIPGPGQYLLASQGPVASLAVPLFFTDSAPAGFIAELPASAAWSPGMELSLRGPLGHGFALPAAARRVGLVAFDGSAARLRGLIRPALRQEADVVLICEAAGEDLPDQVEIQPLAALNDVLHWADYAALDVARENLSALQARLGRNSRLPAVTQVLVRTPLPCGGIADCGVCALTRSAEWKLACKDGPVFAAADVV